GKMAGSVTSDASGIDCTPVLLHDNGSSGWLSGRRFCRFGRMAHVHRVGGDVDAFCTRCKMELGHTILAMVGARPVRVRCNTCGGEHNYRGTSGPARKGSWVPAAERAARPAVTSWEALLRQKDLSRARRST